MINADSNIDNMIESENASLNDGEHVESSNFSNDLEVTASQECPICIEEKQNMFALICGHTVCTDCKILLIQHNQLNVCPLCRLPLNWNGILQIYEGNQHSEIADDVIGEVIDADEIEPTREVRRGNNANVNVRDLRMHRERSRDFVYNICACIVSVIFVLLFWVAMTSN